MIKNLILVLFVSFRLLYSVDTISIIATANVHSETDPCGWKKKPLGGLARKATILEQYNDENIYVVDAGNLFFSSESLEDGIGREVALINANIILDSFNKMGCTVFSPGVNDFAAGKDFLLSIEKKSDFPFISSNIYDLNNNSKYPTCVSVTCAVLVWRVLVC